MTEARRLLERLAEVFGCCGICGDAPHNCKLDLKDQVLQRELRAYLAQPSREGELVAALEMLWDYLGRSFDIEKKSFAAPDFDDKWGACEEAEQEWEPKICIALAQGKKE